MNLNGSSNDDGKASALLAYLKTLREMETGIVAGEYGKTRLESDPQGAIDQLADFTAHAAAQMRGARPDPVLAPRTLAELKEELRLLASQPRIPLGLAGLDEALGGGILPRWAVVIGAFTGGGKTALCTHQAIHHASAGHPTLVVQAELSAVEQASRIDVAVDQPGTELPALSIMSADADIDAVLAAAQVWMDGKDSSEKCPVLIVDYLQKLRAPHQQSREREVGYCAEALQHFGRKHGAIIVAAAQLNRKSREAAPEIHHLRESGLIEQIADVALLLSKAGPDRLHVKIGKHRWGCSDGEVDLSADFAHCRFGSLEARQIYGPIGVAVSDYLREAGEPVPIRKLSSGLKVNGRHPSKADIVAAAAVGLGFKVEGNNAVLA